MICLIALSVNLAGMLLIYSFMVFFLARLHWHGRGTTLVMMTIIAAALFWIVPTMIGFGYSIVGSPASYSLCFGNWLVSAFAVILFSKTVQQIPRELEDAARLDGCSRLGTFSHVVLPLVRPELGFIAVFVVMATALSFWASLTGSRGIEFRPLFGLIPCDSLLTMLTVSVMTSLPVIAIFFAAKPGLGKSDRAR